MFSMAGVPPVIGFTAKLAVLQAVLEEGFVWIAVFAVVLSVVGAFYYLRVIKLMFFGQAGRRRGGVKSSRPALGIVVFYRFIGFVGRYFPGVAFGYL